MFAWQAFDLDTEKGKTNLAETDDSDLFHRVKSLVPDDQSVTWVGADTSSAEALEIMSKRDFSQLPVKSGDRVLGLFSLKSFALRAPSHAASNRRIALGDIAVSIVMDRPKVVAPSAEIPEIFQLIDKNDAVMVGYENDLQGIVTAADVLVWLHRLAEPFVRLGEIERSLREILTRRLGQDAIRECAARSLASKYAGREESLPRAVSEMTLDELRLLIINGENWKQIEPALGTSLDSTKVMLEKLPGIRNSVFHFRGTLGQTDLGQVRDIRDWLSDRLLDVGGDPLSSFPSDTQTSGEGSLADEADGAGVAKVAFADQGFVGLGQFQVSNAPSVQEDFMAESPSGAKKSAGTRLIHTVLGPEDFVLSIADEQFRNGERQIRVIESNGQGERFERLTTGNRLTVAKEGELSRISLGQARMKDEIWSATYKASLDELNGGCRTDIAEALGSVGMTQLGKRSAVMGDKSSHRDRLVAVFPDEAALVPLAAYVLTRIAPVYFRVPAKQV